MTTDRPITPRSTSMTAAEARATLGERYADVERAAAEWAANLGRPAFAR